MASSFLEFNFDEIDSCTKSRSNDSTILFIDPTQTSRDEATGKIMKCVETFTKSVSGLKMTEKDANSLFKSCANLVDGMKCFVLDLFDLDEMTAPEAVDIASFLVRQQLFKFNSSYRRKKEVQADQFYVLPKEIAIGTRYTSQKKKIKGKIIKIPRLIQATFHYVSINETLKSLFSYREFSMQYFEYQTFLQNDHKCEPGVYEYFCCGNVFKNCPLFQQYPDSLQLQIATDDFEICNPLASKANRHKICAVYFSILNLPKSYLSKRKFVFPVVICNSDEVKMKHTDFNNIWYPIVNEIKELESQGIPVMNFRTNVETDQKGTIAQFCSDNLGANVSLGFTGSFQCDSYCRHCECSKTECERMTREDRSRLRTIETYEKQLDVIANSSIVNFKETKGVKYYCILSDLKYFHIISNPSVDTMHDIPEGGIPFVLKLLITQCVKAKIFSLETLNSIIQQFDFGFLDRRSIPSEINLNKRSLGQNAAQSLCLFRCMPFILHRYNKNAKFKALWRCVQPLHRIIEVSFSSKITEADLNSFNDAVHELASEIRALDVNLLPKIHFFLHYMSVTHAVGPVSYMNMMRYERKHNAMKQCVRGSQSFKNINQTIALKHQQNLYSTGYSYKDDLESGALFSPNETFFIEHETLLNTSIFANSFSRLKETKWLRFNHFEYRRELLIVNNECFCEILKILFIDNIWSFLCKPLKVILFDLFLNSYKVEKNHTSNSILVNFESLSILRTYEICYIASDKYVKADTLELRRAISSK